MTQEDFKNLFDTYFSGIRNYIFYRSGNAELATDIAQETFLKIWEKRYIIHSDNIQALLYKIANDLFISQYRKQKLQFDFFRYYHFNNQSSDTENTIYFNELKINYEKALKKMNEKQRTVFLLSRIENKTYNQIADILGLSIKAVEKRMNAALKHLRKFLNEE